MPLFLGLCPAGVLCFFRLCPEGAVFEGSLAHFGSLFVLFWLSFDSILIVWHPFSSMLVALGTLSVQFFVCSELGMLLAACWSLLAPIWCKFEFCSDLDIRWLHVGRFRHPFG